MTQIAILIHTIFITAFAITATVCLYSAYVPNRHFKWYQEGLILLFALTILYLIVLPETSVTHCSR